MKKSLSTLMTFCVLVIGICFGLSVAFAGEQTWTFDTDATGWTVANGSWEVHDGAYQEVSGADPAMHTLAGDPNWSDYTVEAKVRLDEGNWAGLVFRAQNEFEYYVYYLNVQDNKSELWRHKQGGFDQRDAIDSNIAPSNVAIVNGEWFDVMVSVAGDTFTLSINGEMQAELQDTTGMGLYETGEVGVWTWQTQASFDDVKVSGEGITGSVTPVQPLGKLTTTWAKIKRHD